MKDIEERLSRCFGNVFPDVPPGELCRLSAASEPGWDSVAQVTLLAAIAEEFSLDFAPDDFAELTSFALIADYVEAKVSS